MKSTSTVETLSGPSTVTASLRRRSARLRIALAALLAPLAMLVSGVLGTAPAHAAGGGTLNACFTFLWGGGSGAWAYPTNVQANLGGVWYNVGSFKPLTSNGCLSINGAQAGYYWRFNVATKPYAGMNVYCTGTSNSVYVRAGYTYNLGRVWVYCK